MKRSEVKTLIRGYYKERNKPKCRYWITILRTWSNPEKQRLLDKRRYLRNHVAFDGFVGVWGYKPQLPSIRTTNGVAELILRFP